MKTARLPFPADEVELWELERGDEREERKRPGYAGDGKALQCGSCCAGAVSEALSMQWISTDRLTDLKVVSST